MLSRISRHLIAIVTLITFAPVLAKDAALDSAPQNLVKRADGFRQIYAEAIMNVRLTMYVGKKRERESVLKVAVQGSEKSLIRVVDGADGGQQMLMTNTGLWVKLPRSTRAIRITPMQRLLGEAVVGDIGRMRWQDDYVARFADAKGPKADDATTRLELTANSDLATYPRILLTISTAEGFPIEATFFLMSGKALKSVSFDKPEKINDRVGIKRMLFKDLLKPENTTEMMIEQTLPKALPGRLYAIESLGEWQ